MSNSSSRSASAWTGAGDGGVPTWTSDLAGLRAVLALSAVATAAVTATAYIVRRRRRKRLAGESAQRDGDQTATAPLAGSCSPHQQSSLPTLSRSAEVRRSENGGPTDSDSAGLHVQAAESLTAAATSSPPPTPHAGHLQKLASSVPFLSTSLRLQSFEGRGIGFIATKAIGPGELLLIDSMLATPTDDQIVYDWSAHAQLVRQLYAQYPGALEVLYVGAASQSSVGEQHPIPKAIAASPLPGVSDAQWRGWMHAVANNAYLREQEDEDEETMNTTAAPSTPPRIHTGRVTPVPRPSEMVLLLLTCKLNHSCYPNAASSNGRVYAVDHIGPGDEVMVSYLLPEQGLYLPTAQRQQMLRSSRHFDCQCARCQGTSRTMREIESALTYHELDDAALSTLEQQISTLIDREGDTNDEQCVSEQRLLAATLSSLYDPLPASHWLRYQPRRQLLLSPPSWLVCQPSEYLRLLLEHWSVTQLLLPTHHLYKALEVEELAQVIDQHQRLTRDDFRHLFQRIDEAFQPDAPLAHLDNDSIRTIWARRFQARDGPRCSVVDCPNAEGFSGDSGGSSAAALSECGASVDAEELPSAARVHASTFVCARCDLPLVACASECHFALVQYHAEICSLLALTKQ
jgi:hypothetical protein